MDSNAWNNKGTILIRNDQKEEALICFKKALEINPEDNVIYYNIGRTLMELKGTVKL
jgi:Flp pilus assembly protein TadD, contains TPR repeats